MCQVITPELVFAIPGAGALVVSSVDGDYLRTPFTKAGWGLFDYNVVVGDTEAPSRWGNFEWKLMEGTSLTAAAAVSPSRSFSLYNNNNNIYIMIIVIIVSLPLPQ
jgi:hypothetical protein